MCRISAAGEVEMYYRGLGRPQGIAFDAEGRLYAAASLGGKRGVVRITPDGQASPAVAGPGLVGLAFGFAYPRHRLLTTIVAVLMIGALEVLQLWAPGRHARLEDFTVDALAACVGFAIAAGLTLLDARSRSTGEPAVRRSPGDH